MKKNNFIQYFRANTLPLILILALIIRIGFFVSLQPWSNEVVNNKILVTDAAGYNQLAKSLIFNRSFEEFNAFRTPGYPVFLALLYTISSGSIWFVFLIQIVLNLASIGLVYAIANAVFSKKAALITAFLFSIDINPALFSLTLLTDTLFVFLFLCSVYFLCRSHKETLLPICLSALFLGIATLVRPISFLFPFIAIVFIILINNFAPKTKLLYSIVFSIVFLTTISPWIIRNYSKYNTAKLSSLTGYNLLYYNAAATEAAKTGRPIEEVRKSFYQEAILKGCDSTDFYSFKNSEIFSEMGKQYINDNFPLYCVRHFRGIINLFCGAPLSLIASVFHRETESYTEKQFSGNFRYLDLFRGMPLIEILIIGGIFLFLLINYLFMPYGVFLSLGPTEKRIFIYLFLAIILYFAILTGVVGVSRYRLPFMPFIYMLSAVGIFGFFDRVKKYNSNKMRIYSNS